MTDTVTAYARAVVAGTVVAGRLVRLACERHLRDLRTLPARGFRWSLAHAAHAIEFFPKFLCLAEGEHAGKPFTLQPWQQFVVGSLFGWLGPEGFRRFRTAYVEAGKGAGKTPLLAGIGLYGMTCDDEPGAQIFCAAVTREQATILFDDARNMAEASPELAKRLVVGVKNIADPETRSFMRPVSSEGKSLDAKRVHMALIDEIHEHPTAVVVDKMRLGIKGRRQGLVAEITNSGFNRASVCWEHHDLSRRVLEGVEQNESWFAYVCGLDPCDAHRAAGREMPEDGCKTCDDWQDERVWPKANPNLGVSVSRAYLREVVRDAIQVPSKQNLVRRLNFCTWTQSATRWLPAEVWAACGGAVNPAALRGRQCYAGVDLATTTDLAAAVLLFPDSDGGYDVLAKFWCPAESIVARSRADGVPYEAWRDQGFLEATPGNVIDYETIKTRVVEWATADGFWVTELAYDPWNATGLITTLMSEGVTCVPIRQGYASLSAPTKEVDKLARAGRLRHGNHPVLAWCMANAVLEEDASGNLKPSKARSTERIDGAIALVVAMARAMLSRPAGAWEGEAVILGPPRSSAAAPW